MNIFIFRLFFLTFFLASAVTLPVSAHDGVPLEADGCHECRPEDGCFFFDYWSVPRITRHCHAASKAVLATTSVFVSPDTKKLDSGAREARVFRVLSGDELEVEFEDDTSRALVQLLGVQNPASYGAEDSPLCREKMEEKAVSRLKDTVLDKKVELRESLTGEDAREDGMLFRAVFRGKKFMNKEMLADGYAMVDEAHAFEFLSELSDAEISAREAKKGVWNPAFCDEKKEGAFLGMLLNQVSRYRSLPALLQYAFAAFGILGIYFFGRFIRRSRVSA